MDVAISVCLDIALIAVIAVFVAIGVRKGFLRSIIGIVGCIVAVIVAVSFSSGVGEKINDKFVHEPVRKWVVNQLTPDPGNVESSEDLTDFLKSNRRFSRISAAMLTSALTNSKKSTITMLQRAWKAPVSTL